MSQEQKGHGQAELNNMLVKKSVLNEIKKKIHSLTVSSTEGRSKGQHIKI